MDTLKRALTSVRRNWGKSLLLLSIVLMLGTLLAMAISVHQAFYQTEARLRERLPSVATLNWEFREWGYFDGTETHHEWPTIEMIEAVADLPYVSDHDINSLGWLFSSTLTHANVSLQPDWPDDLRAKVIESYQAWLESQENDTYLMHHLQGTTTVRPAHERVGLISLKDGRFMTETELEAGHPVTLVSHEFAQENDLTVGSVIQLENIALLEYTLENDSRPIGSIRHLEEFIEARMSVELEIIGIFGVADDLIDPHRALSMPGDDRLIWNAREFVNTLFIPHPLLYELDQFQRDHRVFNEVFTDIELLEEFWFKPFFLLEDPRDFPAFFQAAQTVLPEHWYVVDASGSFAPFARSMETVLWVADFIFWGAMIAIVVILSLVITLFVRDRKHEIGIYRALGAAKKQVLLQIILEVLTVSLLGVVLALFAGHGLSSHLSRQMLEQEMIRSESENPTHLFSEGIIWEFEIFDPGPMSVEAMLESYDVTLDSQTLLIFFGLSMLTLSAAVVLPIAYLMRLNPKKILL